MKKSLWTVALSLGLATQASHGQTIADGLRYLEQEQYGNARKTLQELYNKNQTAESAYQLGYFYLKTEKPDSAKIFFEKGITIDAKYALNHAGLGTTKYIAKNKAGAQADFDQALTLSKRKNAEVIHRVAEGYFVYGGEKDPTAAIELLDGNPAKKQKGAKDIAPQDAEIALTLGDAYLDRNNIAANDGGKAKDSYDRAVSINPKLAKAYIKQGNIWVRARNYTRAIEDYKKGIAADPSYSPGYRELGFLYIRAGKYNEGIQNYEEYMKRSDGNMDTQYAYGQFLYLAKQYDKSLEVLRKLEGKFDRPNLYRVKGYDEYELKDYPNSLKSLEMFFSKSPADKIIASDYEYLGRSFIATGKDTIKGIEYIHKAIEMDSTKKDLYEKLFDELWNGKAFRLAAKQREMQIGKTNRGTTNDYISIGTAYYQAKDYQKADSAFVQSIAIQENLTNLYWRAKNASRIDSKAQAERDEKLKKDPKAKLDKLNSYARPYLEKYIESAEREVKDIAKDAKLKPRITEAHYLLAGISANYDNDIKKAEERLKKSLEIDPEYEAAKKMLQKVQDLQKKPETKPEEKKR